MIPRQSVTRIPDESHLDKSGFLFTQFAFKKEGNQVHGYPGSMCYGKLKRKIDVNQIHRETFKGRECFRLTNPKFPSRIFKDMAPIMFSKLEHALNTGQSLEIEST